MQREGRTDLQLAVMKATWELGEGGAAESPHWPPSCWSRSSSLRQSWQKCAFWSSGGGP